MQVLLGLDGSELSMQALEHAIERARQTDDTLTVAVYGGPTDADINELERRVRDRVGETGLDVEIRRFEDDPGSQLVEFAEDAYDLIILGGGTVSPMGKIRLGDVVEFVLANARTSVTLVR